MCPSTAGGVGSCRPILLLLLTLPTYVPEGGGIEGTCVERRRRGGFPPTPTPPPPPPLPTYSSSIILVVFNLTSATSHQEPLRRSTALLSKTQVLYYTFVDLNYQYISLTWRRVCAR